MSPNDVQIWALLIGLLLFGVVVALVYARRRASERASGVAAEQLDHDIWTGRRTTPDAPATNPPRKLPPASDHAAERRRPVAPPPPGTPGERASAVRSLVLRAVAERAPSGWSALVLCPPPHPDQMAWHVHLAPEVALDLSDGRTVTVAAPPASLEWQLPGGRGVGIGDGEIEPPPTDRTVTVRVTGPHLVVSVGQRQGKPWELVARVTTIGDTELPATRAVGTDVRAMQAALREAIELAVGSRMIGAPPAVGYRPSSWEGHERIWLTISG